ncbi:MAG: DUF2382 domain-containing protein [Cyanobacteriota bacterium]|nr:DUF2382 domain-containing protein [Cyanobacteriota bacterium]
MPLYKIKDFYPSYKEEVFGGEDIKGYDVYAGLTEDKIGSVYDLLVDDTGRFRYLVIDTGFWILGKKVLLPVGRCQVDYTNSRIKAVGMVNKEQAERLPEYDDDMMVDYDYEEQVRSVYRTPAAGTSTNVEASAPVETTSGVVTPPATTPTAVTPAYTADTYAYDREPDLYETREDAHQKLKLYEERLVTNKDRYKAGEVAVSKRVETSTAEVAVPIEKEKIVIEFTPGQSTPATTDPNFKEGEVARMDVYEETADIDKEAVVRGEVSVSKEVERDTVSAKETVRREEVDVDRSGNPKVSESGKL